MKTRVAVPAALGCLVLLLVGELTQAAAPARFVAVTFDDLPSVRSDLPTMQHVTRNLLRTLKAEHIPATGFVNEGKLFVRGEIDARTALLQQWLDAGLDLGNHTWSHIGIAQVPFEAYREDLIRGETVTRMLLAERGRKLRYFRHTQLRTGPTEEYRQQLNALLAERGYIVAPVTIDNNDYLFANAYSYAKRRGDKATMRRLVSAYLDYMQAVFAHFEKLSQEFLHREIKQTLLLHANELNADHFGELVALLRARGYEFITLDDALTDSAYRLAETQSPRGISWLHRWMLAQGKALQPEPDEPAWVAELSRAATENSP